MIDVSGAASDQHFATGGYVGFYRTFFRYLIPSVLGLLCVSTASVVDGLLVAKFIGPQGLAAINLLIPFITFYFGMGLMFAIGCSVRAVYCLGRNNTGEASAIFSNTVLLMAVFSLVLSVSAALLQDRLFHLLGTPPEVMPLLRDYFRVLLLGLLPQLLALTLYYFVRGLGYPRQATCALALGALVNIVLNVFFLGVCGWGIAAAAWATVAAQVVQVLVLFALVVRLPHGLYWRPSPRRLKNVLRSSANGASEFINEISVGVVIGVMHWLLTRQGGADTLAGFALVNYSLFINCMISCAIAEVVYTLVSQSVARSEHARAQAFFFLALKTTAVFAILYTTALLFWAPRGIAAVFPSTAAAQHSLHYLHWVWPAFLACGLNLVLAARFTGLQEAGASATLALLRSLILPLMLVVGFYWTNLSLPLIAALPVAEWLTLAVATAWYFQSRLLRSRRPSLLTVN